MTLLELVKSIRVTEYKRLSSGGEPLGAHLRGVVFEIDLMFEDWEAIEYSFSKTKPGINAKVVGDFIPLLVKLIDSELKKDSSRLNEKTSYLLKKAQPEFAAGKKKADDEDDEEEDDENVSIPSGDLDSAPAAETAMKTKFTA